MVKRNKELVFIVKGFDIGSGVKVVKMLVAIYYGKGVIYYQQYEKINGDRVAQFVSRKYRQYLEKAVKSHLYYLLMTNCLILYCAEA